MFSGISYHCLDFAWLLPIMLCFPYRDCFFCASSAMHKNEFVQAINSGFHSGGMFCTLSDTDLGNYLLEKVMEFMGTDQPRTLQAVENVGQQAVDPPVFALSPQVCDNTFVIVSIVLTISIS